MKFRSFLLLLVLLLVAFSVTLINASAANYALFSSVSASDSSVNNLMSLYMNEPDYDPFNQYFCGAFGQYDYYLFYSPNLAEDYKFIRYYRQQVGNGYQYRFEHGTGSNLQIITNGYLGVGNVENSASYFTERQFGFFYVITVLLLVITPLVIFRTFRRRQHVRSDRRWTL